MNNDDITAVLKNYINVAESYVKKYGSPFNMNKDTGETETLELLSTVKKEIKAKVSLSKDTIKLLMEAN